MATVELELATSLPLVPCYHDAFNQAILNLIINAAHAIRESLGVADESRKGLIHIATRPVGRAVEIAISDNGSGIPESIRSKIFDPFFTTKPIGMGTGQGLTFVHNAIVEKHRGTISVNSEVGKGTTFILRIPLSQETSGGPPVRPGLSSSMPSQN